MPDSKVDFIKEWNEPYFIYQQLSNNGYFCQPDCQRYLSQTLKKASQYSKTPWEKIHIAQFSLLGLGQVNWLGWIWNRQISTAGDLFSINVGTYNQDFIQTHGPGYRQIIDFSDLRNSLYIHPLGQSEDPFDKHYADLLSLWRNGNYIYIP